MTPRHLLYLGKDGLTAYAWQPRGLVRQGSFAATPGGLADFAAYLKARRKAEIHLLANLRDENHQVEAIPYLGRRDRQAFISRKLDRLFPGTPLTRTLSLGYEQGERRNERLLLSALTQPSDFAPWLDCIATAAAPLAGVYTHSQLAAGLLKRLGELPQRCLLLTRQDDALQESFIVNGDTWFSRLAPLPEGTEAAAALAEEAVRLRHHLVGQSLLGHQDILPVFVLDLPPILDQLPAAAPAARGLAFIPVDLHAAAARLGVGPLPEGAGSAALFLHLLATRPPRRQFADRRLRRHCLLRRFRRGLFAAAALTCLAALSLAVKAFDDSRALAAETAELSAREQELAARQQDISASQPQVAGDEAARRRVNAHFAELERSRRDPGEAYRSIGRALDQAPAIEIASIEWKQAPAAGSSGRAESIAVEGTLAAGLPPRQAAAAFGRFVQALEQDPSLQVTTRRPPFDPWSAQFAGDKAPGSPPTFTVAIVRKAAP